MVYNIHLVGHGKVCRLAIVVWRGKGYVSSSCTAEATSMGHITSSNARNGLLPTRGHHVRSPEVAAADACSRKQSSRRSPQPCHRPCRPAAAVPADVQDTCIHSSDMTTVAVLGPQLAVKTPQIPRTFGNTVRNILFGPERDINSANTVPTAHEHSQGPEISSQELAVEYTLYELNAATAAILGSQVPEIRSSNLKLVFSNEPALLTLAEALAAHGSYPAVVQAATCLVQHLFDAEGACIVPVTSCHIQLARMLMSAATALKRRHGCTAAGVAAEAVTASAVLAAAAPADILLLELTLVEQYVTAARTAAPAAVGTSHGQPSTITSAVLQMLAKSSRGAAFLQCQQRQADSKPSLSYNLQYAGTVYVWERLQSYKWMQLLATALMNPEGAIRDSAQQLLEQVIGRARYPCFLVRLDLEQFAAASTAAVDSICKTSCSTSGAHSSGDSGHSTNGSDVCSDSIRAAVLGTLLSLQLHLCTTAGGETAEQFTGWLLQLEQQQRHHIAPEQLKVVRAINAALDIVLRAKDGAAISAAYALIVHLLSASRKYHKQAAVSNCRVPTGASNAHVGKQVPRLQEKHFPGLKAIPSSVKRAVKTGPSCFASLAACLCFCVLPAEWDDWEARLASAVVLQPRHGMNSSAVFERELSAAAGLFSSRRLRKLVKVQNRGVVL